jgi:hypothetical protein
MPVVALGTTEVHEAVPPRPACVSTKVDVLVDAMRRLVATARGGGARARRARAGARALRARALPADWDDVLEEVGSR